jgi:hypothetical protein
MWCVFRTTTVLGETRNVLVHESISVVEEGLDGCTTRTHVRTSRALHWLFGAERTGNKMATSRDNVARRE